MTDSGLRRSLADEANRAVWSVAWLEQRIRTLLPPAPADLAAGQVVPARLLTPKRGTPGLYQDFVTPGGGAGE